MKQLLERLFHHEVLLSEEAEQILLRITQGAYNDAEIAALLTVFRMRGIHTDELLGFRKALLSCSRPIDLSAFSPIDIVGTGGDGKNTFNISTCACFVVGGAGYNVAKHGNYGASSVSGASTVLEQHGVKFNNDPDKLKRSIDTCHVAYLHAPLFHPALASVAPVRRALHVKTVFNLLGPLVNPCRPSYQLLGVSDLAQMRLYTQALQRLGLGFAIVNSLDGYDEISLTDDFKVITNRYETIYTPEELGLKMARREDLSGGNSPEEAARIFDDVLRGEATEEQANCVLINASFAIRAIRPELPIEDCVGQARESLLSGRALQTFKTFVELNS